MSTESLFPYYIFGAQFDSKLSLTINMFSNDFLDYFQILEATEEVAFKVRILVVRMPYRSDFLCEPLIQQTSQSYGCASLYNVFWYFYRQTTEKHCGQKLKIIF